MVIGVLLWGKIFKAKKIAEAIFRAGKAVVTFFQELKWARAIIKGAAEAAQRAKAKAKTKKGAGQSGGDGGSCPVTLPKPHSFIAGTAVLLADGSFKPIEKVQAGDRVLATEGETGRSEARQVTHTIRTDNDKDFVDLTVRDRDAKVSGERDKDRTEDSKRKITTTDHHPFWSVSQSGSLGRRG